jgi:tetraacyldisaccharide 4'-kinase
MSIAAGESPPRQVWESDCIVLDDGFQHRQIARDLDIVLIDATRNPFADRLLPAGWLREPVSSLARAGAVVLTHGESAPSAKLTAIECAVARIRGNQPAGGVDALASHAWSSLSVRESQGDADDVDHPVAWLAGRRVLAVCAIGNPAAFVSQVRSATGVPLADQVVLRDHDPYSAPTIRRIIDAARRTDAQAIVTTDKDWSKLRHVKQDGAPLWPCPVARPCLIMDFARGGEELRQRVLAVIAAGAPE